MGAFDILGQAKEIAELVRKYNNMELYQKIVDLRDEIYKISEENLSLKERVKELERQQDISAELARDGNVYYRAVEGGKKIGPYCMACWDADRKLVNLILGNDAYGNGTIKCGRCTTK